MFLAYFSYIFAKTKLTMEEWKDITDTSNRHKCYVEYLKEFGKPYTAEGLDEILEDYPIGEANLFE